MSIRKLNRTARDGRNRFAVEVPWPGRPGKMKRVGVYDTEGLAKDAEFEAEKKRREGRLATSKTKMTVADLCREWLAYNKAR
jgi:tryptophanyl-tRNA synthetase